MGTHKREDGKGDTKRVNTARKREFKMSTAQKRKRRIEKAKNKESQAAPRKNLPG